MQYYYVLGILFAWLAFSIKLSILLQYIEVFVPAKTRPGVWWVSQVLIWVLFFFYCIKCFLQIFDCNPIAKQWDPLITEGKCLTSSSAYLYISTSAANSASDLVIILIPQLVIWRLQVSFRKSL